MSVTEVDARWLAQTPDVPGDRMLSEVWEAAARQMVPQMAEATDVQWPPCGLPAATDGRWHVGGLGWPGRRILLGSITQRIPAPLRPFGMAGRAAATSGLRRLSRARKGQ